MILDSKLSDITAGNFRDLTDCRTALQHIAIAGRLSVFQDRFGNVVMKTFETLRCL
jgi:hypothetical protein